MHRSIFVSMNLKAVDWNLLLRKKTRFLSRFFSPSINPEKWVFILGCYNSGTTLLHDVLATHPSIGSMPREGQFFTDQLPTGAAAGLPRLWALDIERFHWTESTSPHVDLPKLKRDWAWFYNRPHSPVLLEKTVLNAARSRWLQQVFPNAWFVSIYRDPYAVCSGISRKEGHDLEQAARQWDESNRILLEDIPYLKNHMSVTYEELTADPSRVYNAIIDFLGLPKTDTSLHTQEFRVHGWVSRIRNMNAESIQRLTDSDRKLIRGLCSDTMMRLGYD